MISRERLYLANKKARKRISSWYMGIDYINDEDGKRISKHEAIDRYYNRYRKVTAPCSGPCCGNPRHHFGELTLQERKADARMREELPAVAQLA